MRALPQQIALLILFLKPLVKQIISVRKDELEKREANYQQNRAAKKACRKTKLQALAILAFVLVSVGCVSTPASAPRSIRRNRSNP